MSYLLRPRIHFGRGVKLQLITFRFLKLPLILDPEQKSGMFDRGFRGSSELEGCDLDASVSKFPVSLAE